MDVKAEEPGGNNVHNNAFYAEERLLKSELEAMRDCSPLSAHHWIVRHPYPSFRAVLLVLSNHVTHLRSIILCLNSFS